MASGTTVPKDTPSIHSPSSVSVILRVKRKREEDPLDALGMSHIYHKPSEYMGHDRFA